MSCHGLSVQSHIDSMLCQSNVMVLDSAHSRPKPAQHKCYNPNTLSSRFDTQTVSLSSLSSRVFLSKTRVSISLSNECSCSLFECFAGKIKACSRSHSPQVIRLTFIRGISSPFPCLMYLYSCYLFTDYNLIY